MSVKRRDVLRFGAAGAAATAVTACGAQPDADASGPAAPAVARRQTVRLSMVTTWPKNFPGLGTAAERVAEYARTMSDGALEITVFAAGELAPAFESFDAVSSGAADMYHGVEYYWQGKSPAFNFFGGVPFGLTAQEHMAWMDFGGGQQLWDDLSAQFGVKPLVAGNTGHQMGGWFKKEINSLDDFRGLKMRIPGLGGAIVRALGGAPVSMPGGEIYQSLQSGAIDATEWVGPWNDRAFGFQREAPFYYGPGFHEPGTSLSLGVNLATWEALASDHKAILEHACAAVTARSIAEFNHNNAIALQALITEDGVERRDFPDDVWAAAGEAAEQTIADVAAADTAVRPVYDSFIAARSTLAVWTDTGEAPYLRRRADARSAG